MASPTPRCIRCGDAGACHTAAVPHPSIYQARDPCPHGPFCARCGNRKEELTLPQCECRALICSWSPLLPVAERRPRPKEQASEPIVDDAPLLAKARASLREAPMAKGKAGTVGEAPQADLAAVLRRALAAVDGMIATVNADPEEPREDEGTTLPRVEAELQPRRQPQLPATTLGGATLAESLQLRGGRPLAAKAPSNNSLLSYINYVNDAIKHLYDAYESFESSLGCVNPSFADSEECRRAKCGRGGG
mmetsp:Transcript_8894/g.23851  ORF Transcript_8894/g.23851 Transcript_8894/m.23851 type:complete len:249 (+) Transcript_8894:69-815(+)